MIINNNNYIFVSKSNKIMDIFRAVINTGLHLLFVPINYATKAVAGLIVYLSQRQKNALQIPYLE